MIPQGYFEKVKSFFNGDIAATWRWFVTVNSNIGCVSPLEMIKTGQIEKVKKFIDSKLQI